MGVAFIENVHLQNCRPILARVPVSGPNLISTIYGSDIKSARVKDNFVEILKNLGTCRSENNFVGPSK